MMERPEQFDIFPVDTPIFELTPVEKRGNIWIKRDDLFSIAGVQGGKVRTCSVLAQNAVGLVTAGSRASPQANIVAHIAKALKIPCRVHTPQGKLSPELLSAQTAGAEIIQHKAGYNTVIIKRAKDDALRLGWTNIPFGMACKEAVIQTRKQVDNLPSEMKRIVVPVGSGMSMAGILWGLIDHQITKPVLGIKVGADPTKRLDEYAPVNWQTIVSLITCEGDYHKPASNTELEGIRLDSGYESKCIDFLKPGDLFWIVGIRKTESPFGRTPYM